MFCTECGTQVDAGKKFCKNCGARLERDADATSAEGAAKTAPVEEPASPESAAPASWRVAPMPVAPAHENGGNKKLIMVGAGVAVVALAAAGVYFGTDSLKPSPSPTTSRVAEPMTKAAEAPPLPSFEDAKDAGPAGDNPLASGNPPVTPEPMPPQGQPEILAKPAPRVDAPPAPTPSQMQRAGQDAAGRTAKSQASISVSRGGAAAGIYEIKRATAVHEGPSASAKTVANIPQGTRVNVVSSSGDWLEVHSKSGNPPGFIRRDDATFIEKSN